MSSCYFDKTTGKDDVILNLTTFFANIYPKTHSLEAYNFFICEPIRTNRTCCYVHHDLKIKKNLASPAFYQATCVNGTANYTVGIVPA